ncbi:MAG TPA: hypothetical protein VKW06_08235 [Candidatus Angelobacter sp.]|nr:hypothetical protein [Candidatus Angelobacter sp.]
MKALLALFLIVATACDGADLKVKLSVVSTETLPDMDDGCPYILCVSVPDQPSIHEEVMYVHGSSQRIEFTGVVMGQGQGPFSGEPDPAHHLGNYRAILPHMAVITHCDTGRVIELDLDSHEYREFRQPRYPSEKQFRKEVERVKKDALRRVRWQTQDTGETKEFFGHVARRQITTIGGMSRSTAAERIDGWYLDLPEPGCAPEYLRHGQATMLTFDSITSGTAEIRSSWDCLYSSANWGDYRAYSTLFWAEGHFIPVGFREVTRLKYFFNFPFCTVPVYVGFPPRGLAVSQTITDVSTRAASVSQALNSEVSLIQFATAHGPLQSSITELSDGPIDPALFEVPAGFVKVKQLYRNSQVLEEIPAK